MDVHIYNDLPQAPKLRFPNGFWDTVYIYYLQTEIKAA